MKPILISSLIAFCSLFSPVYAQVQQLTLAELPGEFGFSPTRLGYLDEWLESWVNEKKIPHAVTLVAKRGRIVHFKAYGSQNIQQGIDLKRDDIFRIASQTKAITTVAILMLHEEGKLLFDDPLSKYMPYFANPKVLVSYDTTTGAIETRPAKREITIRDLLTHTSGIPYNHPLENLPEYKVPYLNSLEPDKLTTVVPKIAARPLLHDPGEKFTYGLNTDVLGYIVELISGKPLDSFFSERIFGPLGMKDTHFYLPLEKAPRLVELYAKPHPDSALALSTDFANRYFPLQGARSYFSGGAGLVGPIEDYAKFCQFLLNRGEFNGKRLLSTRSVDMMFRDQIGRGITMGETSDQFSFGLGIFSGHSDYGDLAAPGTAWWGGAYGTEYTIDPKENIIMLVYTNMMPFVNKSEFLRKFRTMVYQAMVE